MCWPLTQWQLWDYFSLYSAVYSPVFFSTFLHNVDSIKCYLFKLTNSKSAAAESKRSKKKKKFHQSPRLLNFTLWANPPVMFDCFKSLCEQAFRLVFSAFSQSVEMWGSLLPCGGTCAFCTGNCWVHAFFSCLVVCLVASANVCCPYWILAPLASQDGLLSDRFSSLWNCSITS